MEIATPKSLEALVRRKLQEGRYSTEEEVVADALRLVQARDDVVALKRARLKDATDRGYDDAVAGRVTPAQDRRPDRRPVRQRVKHLKRRCSPQ